MKLVVIDTETGGLDPSYHSLLSIALIMYDTFEGVGGRITSTYSANLLPIADTYHVSQKALEVNGINLVKHAETAKRPEVVAQDIINWIHIFAGDEQPLLVGWNVQFDKAFLTELLGKSVIARLFSFRSVDLHAIIAYKSIRNEMPYTRSLEKTAQYLGILKPGKRQPHSACLDAIITTQVLRRLIGG